MKRLSLGAAVVVALMGQGAQADYISAILPAASPIATFSSISVTPPFAAVANDDTPTASPNTVSFNLAFSETGTAIMEVLTLQTAGTPVGTGAVEYLFTVAVTNNWNRPIGPINIDILPGSGVFPSVAAFFDAPALPAPTSSPGANGLGYQYADATPTRIWFGGANGGGGQIPVGGTQTLTFSVDIPISAAPIGSFQMAFTANPEPATMALAGLALGAAGYYVRRRRTLAVAV